MKRFCDMLSSAYATSFLFLLVIIVLSLSFNSAAVIIRLIQVLKKFSHNFYVILYNMLKVILLDLEMGKILTIIIRNFMQLIFMFNLSLTSQQLLDYSSGIQEVMCVYLLCNSEPYQSLFGIFNENAKNEMYFHVAHFMKYANFIEKFIIHCCHLKSK